MQLDVTKAESLEAFISSINADYKGEIYALINNAGIYPPEWDEETFSKTKATNFEAPVTLCLRLGPALVEGQHLWTSLNNLSKHKDSLSSGLRVNIVHAMNYGKILNYWGSS